MTPRCNRCASELAEKVCELCSMEIALRTLFDKCAEFPPLRWRFRRQMKVAQKMLARFDTRYPAPEVALAPSAAHGPKQESK